MTSYRIDEDERVSLLVPKVVYMDGVLPRELALELLNNDPCIPGLVVGMPVNVAKEMIELSLEAVNTEMGLSKIAQVKSYKSEPSYSNLAFQ